MSKTKMDRQTERIPLEELTPGVEGYILRPDSKAIYHSSQCEGLRVKLVDIAKGCGVKHYVFQARPGWLTAITDIDLELGLVEVLRSPAPAVRKHVVSEKCQRAARKKNSHFNRFNRGKTSGGEVWQ